MNQFIDSKGENWNLHLDVGAIEDVKESTNVDFDLLLTDPTKLADVFLASPRKIVEILYVLCSDQIAERKLTPRDFGRRFDRPTLDAAADAIIAAVLDFYPRSSAGRVIRGKLPALLADMDKRIAKEATRIMEQPPESSNTVTDLPES